jgi:hypothetical protein
MAHTFLQGAPGMLTSPVGRRSMYEHVGGVIW